MENPFISIVSPVYKAENIIEELVSRIEIELGKITTNYEIILIEDCSPDESWKVISKLAHSNEMIKGVSFSRNFGQHMAIKSGLELSKGDCCIVMDFDLQDDPIYFQPLVEEWQKGNDIVYTKKEKRAHSKFKNFSAILYNKIFNFLVELGHNKTSSNVGSFSLVSRKVVKYFNQYNDYQFHYLMVLRWLGFKSSYITIQHRKRFEGKSSYNFKKLMEHAIVGIVYQSDKLLRLSIYLGFLFSTIALIAIIVVVIKYFVSGFKPGWASIIVLILLSTGLLLTAIGVLGLYLGKVFEQVKQRPQYVIDKTINI